MAFNEAAYYLKCSDRNWDVLWDSPLIISRISSEALHKEAYDSIPQWGIIENILLGMFSKMAVNSIMSTLRQAIYREYIDTAAHPHSIRMCFQIEPEIHFPTSTKVCIEEEDGSRSTHVIPVVYCSRPPRCLRCSKFGHWSVQCKPRLTEAMRSLERSPSVSDTQLPQRTALPAACSVTAELPSPSLELQIVKESSARPPDVKCLQDREKVAKAITTWSPDSVRVNHISRRIKKTVDDKLRMLSYHWTELCEEEENPNNDIPREEDGSTSM